jgi:hypothetical protein
MGDVLLGSKQFQMPTLFLELDQALYSEYCMQSLRQKNTVCIFDNDEGDRI